MIRPIKKPYSDSNTEQEQKPIRKISRSIGRPAAKPLISKSVVKQASSVSDEWLDEDDTYDSVYKLPYCEEPIKEKTKLKLDKKRIVKFIIECILGFGLLGFGIINTGSYYIAASRFSGILATVFYTYQSGTIMIIVGIILVYDAVKRTEMV